MKFGAELLGDMLVGIPYTCAGATGALIGVGGEGETALAMGVLTFIAIVVCAVIKVALMEGEER